ncbi:MAG: rhomboid family intramembrane serine protease [Lentisphaerota bacterium]
MNQWNSYSFSPGPARMPPGVKGLLIVTVAAYFIQMVMNLLTGNLFIYYFGLSFSGIRSGFVWQIVTYMFLHGSLWHLLFNMMALYFMGPETERATGTKHFLILYFLSGILGGLGWLLISSSSWIPCVGASGAIFGVIGAFAALFPDRPITLLIFFVLPVTMRAWVMAVGLGVVELGFLMSSVNGGIANAAHLAGGISGYVYALTVFREVKFGRLFDAFRNKKPQFTVLPGGLSQDGPAVEEIDRILDKISRQGIQSLTRSEREALENASKRDR